jgi:hypothetical protein
MLLFSVYFTRLKINKAVTGITWKKVLQYAEMTEQPYEHVDSLFRDIKLRMASMRGTSPEAVDELKLLIDQLEMWFDSLVIDSLKLKKMDTLLQRTAELAQDLQQQLTTEETPEKPPDIDQLLDENISSLSE